MVGSQSSRSAASWHGCAVFKDRERRFAPDWGDRSLKTQQHAPTGHGLGSSAESRCRPTSSEAVRAPGPVDVLEPALSSATRYAPPAEPALQSWSFPRKEVIQPHLPVRLPCYDFTPVTSPTFDGSLPQGVRPPASGVACFRGVTGGVYKARERIHRGNADPRLLATPPSCRRVSACNPNRDAL